jgi:hypothetical protein
MFSFSGTEQFLGKANEFYLVSSFSLIRAKLSAKLFGFLCKFITFVSSNDEKPIVYIRSSFN